VLYQSNAFEPLTDRAWGEPWVRSVIAEIVADADSAFSADSLWPAEEWDAWKFPTPLKDVYAGAAGVIWALAALGRRGFGSSMDLAGAAQRTLESWREAPHFPSEGELPSPAEASLLSGETGLLLVAWQLQPDVTLADTLHRHVRDNAKNRSLELMWGAPGTMLAARAMAGWTGDSRWDDAWQESADALWRARDPDGLWTQHLHGETARGLGPAHGLVGNVVAMLRGPLDGERPRSLVKDTVSILERTAVREEGLVNWPPAEGRGLVNSRGEIRLQWCHGSPGIVVSASDYLPEELLLAGAELIWRAGPHGLEKGAGICHGTAGNGYAFLKAFERTRDELWLERARHFAVHALEQVGRLREQRGRGRYSLFTGDVGTALFAAGCIEARAAFPILDTWE
jgi:hypothetical protein